MPPENNEPKPQRANKGGTVRSVQTLWDFDDRWHEMKSVGDGDETYTFGEEGRFRLKGRCRRCWGGIVGKGSEEGVLTVIRCRVCGIQLEGIDAKEEYQQMLKQDADNTCRMAFGFSPKYDNNARFVNKIFPYIDRQAAEEFHIRTNAKAPEDLPERWLTRRNFPAGSAGFLLLQAKVLVSGIERMPREMSLVPFPDCDICEDGSPTVYVPKNTLSEDPKATEKDLMHRLGSTLIIVKMSAFACELAIKAICLTRMDKARMVHDLWQLYGDLPEDSKERLEEDFPEIGLVLKEARFSFAKHRYFDVNVGGHGIREMIDTERAFALAKAARVLIDEAVLMGLGYSVKLNAKQNVTEANDRQTRCITHNVSIKTTEAPPR